MPLPEGATLVTAPEEPIVSCALPTEIVEVDTEGDATEPEVIGAKPQEDNEG